MDDASVRAHSWRRYEKYVRLHLPPELATVQLSKLGPDQVQRLQDRLIAKGLRARLQSTKPTRCSTERWLTPCAGVASPGTWPNWFGLLGWVHLT